MMCRVEKLIAFCFLNNVYDTFVSSDGSSVANNAKLVSGRTLVTDLARLGLSDILEEVAEEIVDVE